MQGAARRGRQVRIGQGLSQCSCLVPLPSELASFCLNLVFRSLHPTTVNQTLVRDYAIRSAPKATWPGTKTRRRGSLPLSYCRKLRRACCGCWLRLRAGGRAGLVCVGGATKCGDACANDSGDAVSVLLGSGNGTFASKVDDAAGSVPSGLAVGDFNGDKAPDVALANGSSSTASILLSQCK